MANWRINVKELIKFYFKFYSASSKPTNKLVSPKGTHVDKCIIYKQKEK